MRFRGEHRTRAILLRPACRASCARMLEAKSFRGAGEDGHAYDYLPQAFPLLWHRESHADSLLAGVESLAPDGSVEGSAFRAHYPQLETKLTVRGATWTMYAETGASRAGGSQRFGNFILAEDDRTLEGVVLAELEAAKLRCRS